MAPYSLHWRVMRDARAALTSAAAGETDGAVVYQAPYATLEPRLATLSEVTWLREAPLPVMAVNQGALGATAAQALADRLESTSLPAIAGVVERWKVVNKTATPLGPLAQTLRGRRSPVNRDLMLASIPIMTVLLGPLLPAPPEAMPLNPVLFMPPRRFDPLPDPHPDHPRGSERL